jgi:DNA-binding transcriptional MerR regulator
MPRSNSPSAQAKSGIWALERFQPAPNAVYSIDLAARLTDLPRHKILVCCKHGFVTPTMDDQSAGYCFNRDAIQVLQRVGALRQVCGNDFAGIKIILELLNRLEQLRSELQRLRDDSGKRPKPNSPSKRKSNRRYDYDNI